MPIRSISFSMFLAINVSTCLIQNDVRIFVDLPWVIHLGHRLKMFQGNSNFELVTSGDEL